MPSNQQRREASRRKLQRQLARREQRARARRRWTVVLSAVGVLVIVAAGFVVWRISQNTSTTAADSSGTDAATTPPATPCTYTATPVWAPSGEKPRTPKLPANTSPLNTGTVDTTITLNGSPVPLTLDRKAAPCAVNSFLSLASQGFFDKTPCHRMTDATELHILQCGDPTGTGRGGPGYDFADEVQAAPKYPVGTVAMANTGAGTATNGSQFFIVYGPSASLSSYTTFGTVSKDGMKAIDAIAAKGVTGGQQDGKPVAKAQIDTVSIPAGALSGTGSYPTTTSAAGTGAPPAEVPTSPAGTPASPAKSAASPNTTRAPTTATAGATKN